MYPILFKIGAFPVYSYGLMVALGFLLGIWFACRFAVKEGLKAETILDLALWVIISSIIGARFFYVIGQLSYYKDNWLEIFMLQRGGLVILGGVLAAILATYLFAKKHQLSFLKLFDICTPATIIGISIGRIGCFLNGCCFGVETDSFLGVVFPPGSLAYSYFPHEHIWPTQLFSSFSLLLVFGLLLFIYKHKKYDGFVFYWGLVLYSLDRFTVEFFRFSPMRWLNLTPSQWLLLVLFGVGVYGLVHKSSSRLIK